MENDNALLPVIIVGKDRTRMTCAVIDHLREHIKNAIPYFICVSDKSRDGHDKAIERHFNNIGEINFAVMHTSPDEGHGGWGAALNYGIDKAFSLCRDATCALVVDNDWLLQKDLDIEKYLYAFLFSNIGAITFKPVHKGTNVKLTEIMLTDGSKYLLRSPQHNGRYSFTAEIGCMLISKNMCERYGQFKENCVTDETEWAFCDWYNSLEGIERDNIRVWMSTDKDLYHEFLNGDNHVFTHVGLVSQHAGTHKWDCPAEYKYLSDDKEDEILCAQANAEDIGPAGQKGIDWAKYFDKIYCIHFLPQKNKLQRLKEELTRVGILQSGIFEWRYTSKCKYDTCIYEKFKADDPMLREPFVNIILEIRRILAEAIYFDYSRILLLENDVAFLKNVSLISDILEEMPREGGLIQFDKFVNDGQSKYIYDELMKNNNGKRYIEYKNGVFSSAACFSLNASAMRKMKKLCDEYPHATDTYFQKLKCKKYFTVPNMAIQVYSPGSWSIDCDGVDYMHKVYLNGNVDYSSYNLPDGYGPGSLFDGEKTINRVATEPKECRRGKYRIVDVQRKQGIIDVLDAVGEKDISILEIGSYAGESASVFIESGKVRNITCIDPWEDVLNDNPFNNYTDMPNIEREFDSRMSKWGKRVKKFKGTLEEYISQHPDECHNYDLVYIDGLHDYEHVKQDIQNSIAYIQPRLGIAGHDYNPPVQGLAGVQKAVDEMFGGRIQIFQDTSWLYKVANGDALSRKIVPKGRKFISVYAIAKNEETVAARWYECVKEADEVCVLDTGSTDNTVKILRELGAHVETKTYEDWSFAVARNDSMKLVSPEADILFTLDLDETIAPGWRKKLEDAWIEFENKGHKPAGMAYKYIWSFYPDGREMQSFAVRKVHANGQGKWKYRCHELLTDVQGEVFFADGFVVEHHQNRLTERGKYLGLLKKDAREMPEDDRSAYYYARELMYNEKWEDAIKEFRRYLGLKSAVWHCERASSMRSIARCYAAIHNRDEQELWLLKAVDEDKDNREATFFLGELYMAENDYKSALRVLERCVDIKKPSLEYISHPIVWTGRPLFLYAQALWWNGRWDDAVEATRKALEIEPSNPEIKAQLDGMTVTRDKYKGAKHGSP